MSNDKLKSGEKQELQRQKWREEKKKQREKKKADNIEIVLLSEKDDE